MLDIEADARFFNFNYTDTLERIYNVESENILYVHGRRDVDDDGPVLGHQGRDGSMSDGLDFENADPRVLESNSLIDDYYESTKKHVSEIIEKNKGYFQSLERVSKVVVLGHSLGEVDLPYFMETAKRVSGHALWSVSYYSTGDLEAIDCFEPKVCCSNNSKVDRFKFEELLIKRTQNGRGSLRQC